MKHISELMFDAILEKMLERYSAAYVALYLKKKAAMLQQESGAETTLHRTTARASCAGEERTAARAGQAKTTKR